MLDLAKMSDCPSTFFVDFLQKWRQTVAWDTHGIASVDTAVLQGLLEGTICPDYQVRTLPVVLGVFSLPIKGV